ncbi:hypothetical protein WDU94_015123 [Cyamophila willieti]
MNRSGIPESNDKNMSMLVSYDSESLDLRTSRGLVSAGTFVESRIEFSTSVRIVTPVKTRKASKNQEEFDLSDCKWRQHYKFWKSDIGHVQHDLKPLNAPITPSPNGSRAVLPNSDFWNQLEVATMNEVRNKQKDVTFLNSRSSTTTEQEEINRGDRVLSSVTFDESNVKIFDNETSSERKVDNQKLLEKSTNNHERESLSEEDCECVTKCTESNTFGSSRLNSRIVIEEIPSEFTDNSTATLVRYCPLNVDDDSYEGMDESVSYPYLHGPDNTETWQEYIARKTKEMGDKYDQYKHLLKEYDRKKEDQLRRLTDIEFNDDQNDCNCRDIALENIKCSDSAMETIRLLENSGFVPHDN